MYKSFRIKNFRCFKELEINSLERVNLIAGKNNIGKTALLEALFLYGGHYNPDLALRINAFRGIEKFRIDLKLGAEPPWNNIFNNFDTSKEIELIGEDKKYNKHSIKLKMLSKPSELKALSEDLGPAIINTIKTTLDESINKTIDESKGIMTSSPSVQVLKLVYMQKKQLNKYYLILDPNGINVKPTPPGPPFETYFLGSRMSTSLIQEAELFGNIQKTKMKDTLIKVLNIIEPRLKHIETVIEAGNPILHGDIGMDRLIPFPLMGEGIVRLTKLVLRIANASKGVVLIDEIDNGIHHSIMKDIWKTIGELAREFDIQIFATTHSLECIVSAHKAFSEGRIYDFRLHRLERTRQYIRSVTYKQGTLEAAIKMGLEVR
jgi:AAA15 family ATPase/GTPase